MKPVTQTYTRATRAHDIEKKITTRATILYEAIRREPQQQSELMKYNNRRHKGSQSASNVTYARTRATTMREVSHRQAPEQSERNSFDTGKRKSRQSL